MNTLALMGALVLGMLLGAGLMYIRRAGKELRQPKDYALQYYKGLSYLFNEQPDGAIDAFIGSLDVNSDTLETHLALGNMLRKRGEVTKAIKIHQNLLARPGLTTRQLHEAQLELARDYVRSGLLDRAEALLLELVKLSSAYQQVALEHLVEIYQDEQEWAKAIDMAAKLDGKHYKPKQAYQLNQLQAHFSCELALLEQEQRNYNKVRNHLLAALKYDSQSVRASLLFARLEIIQGRYRGALEHLHKVPEQDPDFIIEALDMICECYDKLGEPEALLRYLQSLYDSYPSNSLVLKIAEKLRWVNDDYRAADFIAEQLKERPSIRTLNRLVELYLPHSEGRGRENLQLLKQLVDKVIAEKPSYCCTKCGFSGNSIHWLCPGCKTWGSVRPIRGVAGE